MPWLERLDARAKRWPAAIRWPYLSLKWLLIILGAYLAVGLAFERSGLGAGIVVACALAVIKGLLIAMHRFNGPTSPASPRQP